MANQTALPAAGDTVATIHTTLGTIKVKLFPEETPKTCENFITHAKNGYYDGIIFHRVIKDFMIQGGDPDGTGRGGHSIWGSPFEDEFHPDLHNIKGRPVHGQRRPAHQRQPVLHRPGRYLRPELPAADGALRRRRRLLSGGH